MEDTISRGLPFELGDLWRPARYAGALDEHDNISDAWEADIPPLNIVREEMNPHFDFDLDIPEVESRNGGLEPTSIEVEDNPNPRNTADQEAASDLFFWDLNAIHKKGDELPKFYTWEAFEKKPATQSERSAVLSEAGPSAFDAALTSVEKSIGVLPQDFVLRSLCALALGRSSSLFQWRYQEKCFQQTLEGASVSGTSLRSSGSLVARLVDFGSSIVKLREFAENSRSLRKTSASFLALRSCTASVLEAVDQRISNQVSGVRSLLRLQQLVHEPSQLLAMLLSMVEAVKGCETDESVISELSDRIFAAAQTQHKFVGIMQTLLARVSVPWLERLATDLGFSNTATTLVDYASRDAGIDQSQTRRTSFVDSADRELIQETKAAITLLRHQCRDHSLLNTTEATNDSPLWFFTNHTADTHRITEAAKQYELAQISAMTSQRLNTQQRNTVIATISPPLFQVSWQDGDSQAVDLDGLAMAMTEAPNTGSKLSSDGLRGATIIALEQVGWELSHESSLAAELITSPITRLRPFINTQHKLANGVLLRQLLRDQRLRYHLSMQKSFQLLGNGSFVARLSKTLFSPEVQSAERKRGVVPTAEMMGLRLGSSKDQRWPPASSELQLTLIGILKEASGSRKANDQLSFAIRELPEEEIEQVLDPHSIHALDFLRLQYAVAAPIDAVLTSNTLVHYDGVFRFLLKLLRLDYTTSTLPRSSSGARALSGDQRLLTFAHEARLFVTVLMSHVMDMGIGAPWQDFMNTITALERSLAEEDAMGNIGTKATLGVDGLRQQHETCLDRIRSRLFLKRKQEKLRKAIEAVFVHILKATTVLRMKDTVDMGKFQSHSDEFRKSLMALVDLLKEIVDKPPKSLAAADAEDTEMIRLLLHRLNWNGHYEEHDQTW